MKSRTGALLCAIAMTSLGAAACSDDDGDDDAASETTTAAAATDEAADEDQALPEANPEDPYCAVEREIDGFFEEAFGGLGEDASEEDMRAAAQSASQAIVDAGIIDDALAIAPDELRGDLELLTANVRTAATGDVDVFFTPESDAAGARVDAYCGLED